MNKEQKLPSILLRMMKALLTSYVITGLLLLVLAFLLYQFQLNKSVVDIGIVAIYILSCFIGGFIEGKIMGTKKYIWGALIGLLYFVLLTIISLAVNQGFDGNTSNFITSLLLCTAGGMLGGMLS